MKLNFNKDFQKSILVFIVFVLAFFSYNNNIFKVAYDKWFEGHQIDSEQLVLDGILHGYDAFGGVALGRYSRPHLKPQQNRIHAKTLYAEKDVSGEFQYYKSQYGLQMRVFALLAKFGVNSIVSLEAITAALMSAVVSMMFWLVARDFSFKSSIYFTSVFIFSPWVVVFARNLYWVPALWFIPWAISMYYSPKVFQYKSSLLQMLTFIGLTFFVKCLCGYEYITSIFIATCTPIVYQGLKQKISYRNIGRVVVFMNLTLLFAFSAAIIIHTYQISDDQHSGVDQIIFTAQKRLSSGSPEEIANRACVKADERERDLCISAMTNSLASSSIKVTAKYFNFIDFLPWVGMITNLYSSSELYGYVLKLKEIFTININEAIDLIKFGCFVGFWIFATVLRSAGFVIFLMLSLIYFFKLNISLKSILLISFFCPMSWFFLAKGHSYIHTHMNYVLWYLPFIPYCFLAFSMTPLIKMKVD